MLERLKANQEEQYTDYLISLELTQNRSELIDDDTRCLERESLL